MKILKVKGGTSSLLKRLKERGLSKSPNIKKIVPFKYKKTIVVNNFNKLEFLKKDIQSVGDSFIKIIKQGDSKVQIKLGFNNKKNMDQLMNKYF
jgi:hypothetical protein